MPQSLFNHKGLSGLSGKPFFNEPAIYLRSLLEVPSCQYCGVIRVFVSGRVVSREAINILMRYFLAARGRLVLYWCWH